MSSRGQGRLTANCHLEAVHKMLKWELPPSPFVHREGVSVPWRAQDHREESKFSTVLHLLPSLSAPSCCPLLNEPTVKIGGFGFLWIFISKGPHTALDINTSLCFALVHLYSLLWLICIPFDFVRGVSRVIYWQMVRQVFLLFASQGPCITCDESLLQLGPQGLHTHTPRPPPTRWSCLHYDHPEDLMTVLFTWVSSKPVIHTVVETEHLLTSSSCCPWDWEIWNSQQALLTMVYKICSFILPTVPPAFFSWSLCSRRRASRVNQGRIGCLPQIQDQNRFISYREPNNIKETDRIFNQHSLTILNCGSDQNIPGAKLYYIGGVGVEYIPFHPSFLPHNSWNPWNLQSNRVLATGKAKAILGLGLSGLLPTTKKAEEHRVELITNIQWHKQSFLCNEVFIKTKKTGFKGLLEDWVQAKVPRGQWVDPHSESSASASPASTPSIS